MEQPADDSRDKEPGPRNVLIYWRQRLTRLTSITEQLKLKEFKNVILTLSVITKNDRTDDALRQTLLALLRKWKQVDLTITEAANEAKDNVKYLNTMEKFIEPLYTSDPSAIIDVLPALFNSIKMVYSIARYVPVRCGMSPCFDAKRWCAPGTTTRRTTWRICFLRSRCS
jgi:dynein heavy chain, axonemal